MNNVVLCGRLVKKPELSFVQNSNKAVAKFTLAVNRPKSASQREPRADFIRIIAWEKTAENCERYLDKGSQVCLSGRIQTGSYVNKEGRTVYTTDVVADRVEFLETGNYNNGGDGNSDKVQNGDFSDRFEPVEDELPF